MTTNNAINNTLASPFTVGATSVTSTGTQLNYLNGLTAVPINKIGTQSITATGAFTYTPTTGTQYAIFELQAGGGGSGATSGAAGQSATAGGGGGGGYIKLLVTGSTNLAAITGSVGVGGTAGGAGPTNGGNGGDTTLVINGGTTWTATGGIGGQAKTSSASAQGGGAPGGGSGTIAGTNGTLIVRIQGGNATLGFSDGNIATIGQASHGGNSILGTMSTGTGAGHDYGGGAGGNWNASGSGANGTVGGQGIVIITEFISA